MNNEDKFYTYVYFDDVGTPIYVGKGCNRRAVSHFSRKDKHPLTNKLNKMRRLGTMPEIIFPITNVSEQLALALEIELIALIGRRDLGTGPLCNLTNGGESIIGLSKDSINKMKESKKLYFANNPGTFTGRSHSQDTKDQISHSKKGVSRKLDSRLKHSATLTGTKQSEERKAKQKLRMKLWWEERKKNV